MDEVYRGEKMKKGIRETGAKAGGGIRIRSVTRRKVALGMKKPTPQHRIDGPQKTGLERKRRVRKNAVRGTSLTMVDWPKRGVGEPANGTTSNKNELRWKKRRPHAEKKGENQKVRKGGEKSSDGTAE